MKKSQGFTLIELIIVIIILGILAVTAAPKFIDMQGDARGALLQGVKGSIAGAMNITYAKSALQGDEKKAKGGTDAPEVDNVLTAYGYPVALSDELTEAAGFETTDFAVKIDPAGTAYVYAAGLTYGSGTLVEASECYVKYVEATSAASSDKAKVTIDVDKC
ncbi:MAG: prepilin-type N-terminal cleavage/methylation domain-containing protein [Gammaproteobacteria bacterium]|nr:prepilin-type N-terminal cleavage/methylation domain-containing protein [Gammaproteobacteria bacterium]